jgi:hypothetical protein
MQAASLPPQSQQSRGETGSSQDCADAVLGAANSSIKAAMMRMPNPGIGKLIFLVITNLLYFAGQALLSPAHKKTHRSS